MRRVQRIIAAAVLAFCMSVPSAAPAFADVTAVVGGAPGSEVSDDAETSKASQNAGTEQKTQTTQTAAASEELVPALPTETKAETKAAETKAAEAKPAETKAAEAKPAETKPAETKPAEAKPVEAKPAETTAAETKPSAEKPAAPAASSALTEPEEEKVELISAPAPAETESSVKQEAPPRPEANSSKPEAASGKPESNSSSPEAASSSPEAGSSRLGTDTGTVSGSSGSGKDPFGNTQKAAQGQIGPGVSSEPVEPNSGRGVLAGGTDWNRVSPVRRDIVDMAKSFIGGTYVYGGTSPETGFDCSGFIMYIMKEAANVSLYHQSSRQAQSGVGVSVAEMRPGDIIAYDGTPRDGVVNHVSIYAGDGKAIHAVGTGKGIQMTDWDYSEPMAIRNVLGD